MPVIELRAEVHAPIELVFDLCRSVDVHQLSTAQTNESAIAGVTTGLLELGDTVTWRARHLGVMQTLTSQMTVMDRPHHFRDAMVRGAFKRFDHDHYFRTEGERTVLEERFDFDSPLGPLGWLANRIFLTRYMTRFLETRIAVIRKIAEAGTADHYLG